MLPYGFNSRHLRGFRNTALIWQTQSRFSLVEMTECPEPAGEDAALFHFWRTVGEFHAAQVPDKALALLIVVWSAHYEPGQEGLAPRLASTVEADAGHRLRAVVDPAAAHTKGTPSHMFLMENALLAAEGVPKASSAGEWHKAVLNWHKVRRGLLASADGLEPQWEALCYKSSLCILQGPPVVGTKSGLGIVQMLGTAPSAAACGRAWRTTMVATVFQRVVSSFHFQWREAIIGLALNEHTLLPALKAIPIFWDAGLRPEVVKIIEFLGHFPISYASYRYTLGFDSKTVQRDIWKAVAVVMDLAVAHPNLLMTPCLVRTLRAGAACDLVVVKTADDDFLPLRRLLECVHHVQDPRGIIELLGWIFSWRNAMQDTCLDTLAVSALTALCRRSDIFGARGNPIASWMYEVLQRAENTLRATESLSAVLARPLYTWVIFRSGSLDQLLGPLLLQDPDPAVVQEVVYYFAGLERSPAAPYSLHEIAGHCVPELRTAMAERQGVPFLQRWSTMRSVWVAAVLRAPARREAIFL